jgi:hypothetical protein
MTGVGAALAGATKQAKAAIKILSVDTEETMMGMLDMSEMTQSVVGQ